MAKLYFRYGAMNCGKSISLMIVAHNYKEKGKKTIVMKSSTDTKAGKRLQTRIGKECDVDLLVNPNESIKKYFSKWKDEVSCVLVDEAQFLSPNQVEELWELTKLYDIPVICYGLKVNFQSELFEGSKRLVELSDELEELITICDCGKRAKFNARFIDDEFTLDGDNILIDGSKNNVEYKPMCGKCYIKKRNEVRK